MSANAKVAAVLGLGIAVSFSYPFYFAKTISTLETDKNLSRQAAIRGAFINTCVASYLALDPPRSCGVARAFVHGFQNSDLLGRGSKDVGRSDVPLEPKK